CEKRPAFDFRCATDVQILRCTTLNKFTRQFVLTFIWKVGRVAQDHLTPVWQPFEQSSRDLRRSRRSKFTGKHQHRNVRLDWLPILRRHISPWPSFAELDEKMGARTSLECSARLWRDLTPLAEGHI